jgi:hypothetical protein
MAVAVYILCSLTSALCAVLLLREFRRQKVRLLLWSGLSFVGFSISHVLVFADVVLVPDTNLLVLRAGSACASILLLLVGLIWDVE